MCKKVVNLRSVILAISMAGLSAFCHAGTLSLSDDDVRWLNRITYGINTPTIKMYQKVGRQAFLEKQLKPDQDGLPDSVQQSIHELSISSHSAYQFLSEAEIENQRINALSDGDEKGKARQALNEAQERLFQESAKRHMLRAIYSQAQLKEQMTWFWFNHFNVFRHKGNLRWVVADYEESAIRAHALDKFRDLLRATITHSAMLLYLDNAQSSVKKINENYARELLELHTMGVEGGYTQQDVQELARILTGFGVVSFNKKTSSNDANGKRVFQDGVGQFEPARHDYGDKKFLGTEIKGSGSDELEKALDLILQQPATARFVSFKIATYFTSDNPSRELVERMAREFRSSQGDIPRVLNVMFQSKEFKDSLGLKFKDPMHYVISALRLAYDASLQDDKVMTNLKPVNNMLSALGEGLYGHVTPEGYPLRGMSWVSAGQISKRFEIAKWLGSGNAGLFDVPEGGFDAVTGFPQLNTRLFYDVMEPTLSASTRKALGKAASQWEWNTYLLSSPEFMYH